MGLNIPKQPTIPLMPNMADCLIIGFDRHYGKETTKLLVFRKEFPDKLTCVSAFDDEEADELYKKLTRWDER